jgi:hypothetical protein
MQCWSDFMSAHFPYRHCVSPKYICTWTWIHATYRTKFLQKILLQKVLHM